MGVQKKLQDNRDVRLNSLTFWFIVIVYMESILRIFCFENIFDTGIIYAVFFSFIVACILKILTSLGKEKVNLVIAGILLFLISALYIVQVVYQMFFGKFLVLYSIVVGGIGQVASEELLDTTLQAIKNGALPIILLTVPFLYFCILGKKTIKYTKAKWRMKALLLFGIVGVYFWMLFMIKVLPEKQVIYDNAFDADILVENFGLMHMEMLDVKYHVLKMEPEIKLEISEPIELKDGFSEGVPEETREYLPNILELDFDTLIANESDETVKMLHEYFAASEPTYQNEYTGMFQGYNLITITAEGFSPYVIDQELTPTLYKMMTEGFRFENFYTPIWGVSTSDGEYVGCTGLLPKSGVWSFYQSGKNSMPFCLGNQFEKLGVNLRFAYHNHTYDYYHRDISHPNMGYTYKGLGGGLTTQQIAKTWPESDLQMIEATVGDYIQSEEQFVAYYMTVSGHLEYNKYGNSMARKNWKYVEHLPVSDTVKAYYACNIELDRAMEKLLTELEAAGIADKTVIAIAADHYPYGLETGNKSDNYKYFNEILGHEIETNFELYESTFILYCAGMEEPIVVDKYASNVDILPTISNLFGLEYDSRLLVGKDILSDEEQLVVFSNRSWISERGKYNAETKSLEVFVGQEFGSVEEEAAYIERMSKKVEERFQISALILNEDYFATLKR